jgi:hypothetical protein
MVHPLCIGCAELGDMAETFAYSVPEEQALATICAFFDGPITFLDLDRGHRHRRGRVSGGGAAADTLPRRAPWRALAWSAPVC